MHPQLEKCVLQFVSSFHQHSLVTYQQVNV